MNHITGGQIPAEIWRRVMITAHDGVPPHDFSWLPPEEAPTPAVIPADAPADPAAVSKGAFYGGLTTDFDRAAQDPAAPQPADDPADIAPPAAKAAPTPAPRPAAAAPTNGDGDISGDPRP